MPLRGNTPLSDCLDAPPLTLNAENGGRATSQPPAESVAASDCSSDSDEESQIVPDVPTKVAEPDSDGLISKPDGEVGRLKRGYPLHVVLAWDPKRYKIVKNKVNAYVADYLNHAASSSNQPSGKVDDLTALILAEFPRIAGKYRDGWPVSDLIHLRLKYTSGRIANGHKVPQGKDYPKSLKRALAELDTIGRTSE